MKIKRIISLILVSAFGLLVLSSCADTPSETTTTTSSSSTSTETTATSTSTETTTTTTASETTSATTSTTERAQYAIINDGEFDDENIIVSFGAISDVHLTGKSDVYVGKFISALNQLKQITGNKLDAVIAVGDLTDTGYLNNQTIDYQISQFKKNYENALDPEKTPLIYAIGNHDALENTSPNIEKFEKGFGEKYFLYDVDTSMMSTGNRHCVVNGIHFISLMPSTYGKNGEVAFDDKTIKWLDETLDAATKENPNQPVIVLTHAMIYNTCYGSTLKTAFGETSLGWYTQDLTETLNKYNQVITFGGHLHFPLNDERSIMQTGFTSLGCGSIRYMAIENGGYEKMKSATVMADCEEFSQGLLVQVDSHGNTRLVRMDFYNGDTIKTAWVVPTPKADGSHLGIYGADRADNEAPTFGNGEFVIEKYQAGKTAVYPKLTFDAASDDDLIHDYIIDVYNNDTGERIKTYRLLADFYKYQVPDYMNKKITQNLTGMKDGITYKVVITARDSWENSCEKSFLVRADVENKTVSVVE